MLLGELGELGSVLGEDDVRLVAGDEAPVVGHRLATDGRDREAATEVEGLGVRVLEDDALRGQADGGLWSAHLDASLVSILIWYMVGHCFPVT